MPGPVPSTEVRVVNGTDGETMTMANKRKGCWDDKVKESDSARPYRL